jgi:hypothetical protein
MEIKQCQRRFHCYKNLLFILQDNLLVICNLVKKERKIYTFPYTIQNNFCFQENCIYFGYDDFICVFKLLIDEVFLTSIAMAEAKQIDSKACDFFHDKTYHNVLLPMIWAYTG